MNLDEHTRNIATAASAGRMGVEAYLEIVVEMQPIQLTPDQSQKILDAAESFIYAGLGMLTFALPNDLKAALAAAMDSKITPDRIDALIRALRVGSDGLALRQVALKAGDDDS